MAKTPGQPKRGKGGRFVAGQEPAPEGQEDEELSEENDWSRGEGFGSIGPAAFGTPSQQASLGDLQRQAHNRDRGSGRGLPDRDLVASQVSYHSGIY